MAGEARGEVAGDLVGHGVGRDGEHRDGRAARGGLAAAQLGHGLDAVHPGHLDVHEHDVDGPRVADLEPSDCALGQHQLERLAGKEMLQHEAVRRVVVDGEDARAQPVEPFGRGCDRARVLRLPACRLAKRQPQQKARARTRARQEVERAAHALREFAADREAEPGALLAVPARALDLGEGLEQPGAGLFRDADAGIADRDLHHAVGEPSGESDLALFGELDRVRHQVVQHLAKPHAVAHDAARELGRDFRPERKALLARGLAEEERRLAQNGREIERLVDEGELAGLDLGQVEDVVDDAEKQFARRLDHVEHRGLVGIEVGLGQRRRHPEDAVHRRADLVAHDREERALGRRGRMGRGAGRLEIGSAAAHLGLKQVGLLMELLVGLEERTAFRLEQTLRLLPGAPLALVAGAGDDVGQRRRSLHRGQAAMRMVNSASVPSGELRSTSVRSALCPKCSRHASTRPWQKGTSGRGER